MLSDGAECPQLCRPTGGMPPVWVEGIGQEAQRRHRARLTHAVFTPSIRMMQFVWVIVDDNNRGTAVQASKRTFRSLEDAYNAGKGALEYWRDKTRRTHPSVDLAQPPPAKPQVEKASRSPLTSSIYSRG